MPAQVGVRTRARAALAMEPDTSARPTPKRKTITHTNQDPPKSSKSPRTRTRTTSSSLVKPLTLLPQQPEINRRCLSPTSAEIPAFCCSNNGSTSLDEDMIKLLDLEVTNLLFLIYCCLSYNLWFNSPLKSFLSLTHFPSPKLMHRIQRFVTGGERASWNVDVQWCCTNWRVF